MQLVPALDYMRAAEDSVLAANPLAFVRGGFISTEDPGVLDEAVAVTRGGHPSGSLPPGSLLAQWGFVWSDIPRFNGCVRVWAERGRGPSLPPGWSRARGTLQADRPLFLLPACSGGEEQLALAETPRGQMTLRWWLQLLLALECDAWVGTRGSK
jgi:hypothetical protein